MGFTTREDALSLPANNPSQASGMKPSGDSFDSVSALPENPIVVIEPNTSWASVNVREAWAHRELLYFLIWRDVKIRYKQTVLGATWAIIQPLFTMLIFTVIFSKVARISSDGIPYPVFCYAALMPWIFFSNAVGTSSNSLVMSAHVITKVYFPRILIPVASVGAVVVDLAFAFIMLVFLLLFYKIVPTRNILMLPVPVLLAMALGVWLSALNVKYRDIRFVVPFLLQLWMFLSPIAYPPSVVPPRWQLLYSLNPLTGIIDAYRSALFGQPFGWRALGISLAITLFMLVYAGHVFRKMEKSFADII